MNQEDTLVDVYPLFPTPIVVLEILDFYKIKDGLLKEIYNYQNNTENRNKTNIFNSLKFQNYFPFIYEKIETSLSPIINNSDVLSPSSIVKSEINITKKNTSSEPKIRSEFDMSGILVIDCPHQHSGDFVFVSPNHNKFFNKIMSEDMKNLYFVDKFKISPSDGKLIIFPSTSFYYEENNKTDMDKVVINFDIKF